MVEIADEPGLAGIDLLAIHYTGKPYAVRDRPRVSVWFAIDSYHGWGCPRRDLSPGPPGT